MRKFIFLIITLVCVLSVAEAQYNYQGVQPTWQVPMNSYEEAQREMREHEMLEIERVKLMQRQQIMLQQQRPPDQHNNWRMYLRDCSIYSPSCRNWLQAK